MAVGSELGEFLRRSRARISPESAGLPHAAQRRVRGLRREEVAELAGMSDSWYVRFESGRARISIVAVQRVADALRLEPEERLRLVALARPDVARITSRRSDDLFLGCGSPLDSLRDFARACSSFTSVAELGRGAAEAVRRLCGPTSFGYVRNYEPATGDLCVVGACGIGEDTLMGHRQPSSAVYYAMEHFVAGRAFAERDILASPCVDLRTRAERIGVRAYHSHPVMGSGGMRCLLGVAFREVGVPDAWQRAAVETAAAIIELTLR